MGDNSPDSYRPDAVGSAYDTSGMPTLSLPPGVYYDAVTLSATTSDPALTVRYTTDHPLPTASSPAFAEPIPMAYDESRATDCGVTVINLRLASFDEEGQMVGRPISASYLFPASPDRFTTRVVSLITEEESLYGERGILTNYSSRGREWERSVFFQYHDEAGKLVSAADLGFRVQGAGTRSNAQKSFRFYARKEYSPAEGQLSSPLFPGLLSEAYGTEIAEFDTFLLRGGASNFRNTMITNAIAFDLMEGSAVEAANFIPTATFLNGEYYGMMMLMEDYDPFYFESHHGIEAEQITTINFTVTDQNTLDWERDDCTEAEAAEWDAVRAFLVGADMSKPENYELACTYLDMENFIQYTVYECYLNNWDWPRNNQRIWRYSGASGPNASGNVLAGGYDPSATEYGRDGRWRFLCKDMDLTHGIDVVPKENGYYPYSLVDTDYYDCMRKDRHGKNDHYGILRQLIYSPAFCRDYHLYVCQFMSSIADPVHYLPLIHERVMQVANEMQLHAERFDFDLTVWDRYLQQTREFVEKRGDLVMEDLNAYIDGKNVENIQPFITSIRLSKIEHGTFTFNGGHFSEAQTIYLPLDTPLSIVFAPDAGYRLADVTVKGGVYDEKNGTLTVTKRNATISVSFLPDSSGEQAPADSVTSPTLPASENILINEVGYASGEGVNGLDWIELYNPTSEQISLEGYTVTVGADRAVLGKILLPPGGFKVLFFDSSRTEGGVYLPFSLSEGDTVLLQDSEGEAIDEVLLLCPVSSSHPGRYPDGGEWKWLSDDDRTPCAPNRTVSPFAHYYSPACTGALLINGRLIEQDVLTFDRESGRLTTTRAKLTAIKGLEAVKRNRLLSLFSDYGMQEEIDLNRWASEEAPPSTAYLSRSLGSLILHI